MPSRLRGILATVSDVACADTVGGQLIHFLLGTISKKNTGNLGKGSKMTSISISIQENMFFIFFIFKKRHHFVQTFAHVTLLLKSGLVDKTCKQLGRRKVLLDGKKLWANSQFSIYGWFFELEKAQIY